MCRQPIKNAPSTAAVMIAHNAARRAFAPWLSTLSMPLQCPRRAIGEAAGALSGRSGQGAGTRWWATVER
jgi:hypothetical protein